MRAYGRYFKTRYQACSFHNKIDQTRFDYNRTKHSNWEQFVPRHHPSGGYLLLVNDCCGFLARRAKGQNLVAERNRNVGTRWQFIKIH